jgi:biopolymer transport protein ExbD
MGLLRKKKKERLGEITMASTSDVAFLLLIFFIVSTVFAAEQGLVVILPGKQKDPTESVKVKESNIAAIRILPDNTVTLDRKPIKINHIQKAIEDRILANPKLVVVLETHPEADYGIMVACLDEIKLANARKLTLKTTKVNR